MVVRTNETRAKVAWRSDGLGGEWRWLLPRDDGQPWKVGDLLQNPSYAVVAVKADARRCQYSLVNDPTTHPTSFKQCNGTALPRRKGCKRVGHDRGVA